MRYSSSGMPDLCRSFHRITLCRSIRGLGVGDLLDLQRQLLLLASQFSSASALESPRWRFGLQRGAVYRVDSNLQYRQLVLTSGVQQSARLQPDSQMEWIHERTSANALQVPDTGHCPQRGVRYVHTEAPSSIMAWLKSPGRSGSTISSARFHRKWVVAFAFWSACNAS